MQPGAIRGRPRRWLTLGGAFVTLLVGTLAGRFEKAIERVVEHPAVDAPSRVLLERCRALRDAPPPAGWDGVFVATSK